MFWKSNFVQMAVIIVLYGSYNSYNSDFFKQRIVRYQLSKVIKTLYLGIQFFPLRIVKKKVRID